MCPPLLLLSTSLTPPPHTVRRGQEGQRRPLREDQARRELTARPSFARELTFSISVQQVHEKKVNDKSFNQVEEQDKDVLNIVDFEKDGDRDDIKVSLARFLVLHPR